ncbi:hypothetical protein pb186bvf_012265 [Paramecium bursaria]
MSSKNACFIFNLPPNTQEAELIELFEQFGGIQKVQVWDTRFGTSNAVVYYSQPNSANKAIQRLDQIMIKGNLISVKEYKHNVSLNCLGRIILRVPPRVSQRQVEELCSNHGKIKNIEMLDNNHALVIMGTKQQAKYIVLNGLRANGISLEPRLCENLIGDEGKLIVQAFDFCHLPEYVSNDPKMVSIIRDGWEITIESNFRSLRIAYQFVCVRFQYNGPIFAIIKLKYEKDVQRFLDCKDDILNKVFGTCLHLVMNQLEMEINYLPPKQRQTAMNKIYKFQQFSDRHKLNVFYFTPDTVKISAYEYRYYNEKLLQQDAQYSQIRQTFVWKEKKTEQQEDEQDLIHAFGEDLLADNNMGNKSIQEFDESEIIKIVPNTQNNNYNLKQLSIEDLLNQEFEGQKENKIEETREKLKGYKLRVQHNQFKTIQSAEKPFVKDVKDVKYVKDAKDVKDVKDVKDEIEKDKKCVSLQDSSLLDDSDSKSQSSLIRRQSPNLLECEQIIEQLLDDYGIYQEMTLEQKKSKIRDVLKIRIKAAYIMHSDLLTQLVNILEQDIKQSISDLVMLHNDQELLHRKIVRAVDKIQQPIQREMIKQF